MAKSRLHQLSELGQSVWIDYLSRDMLRTGELARLKEEDAVVGVTSNPTIFQKATLAGDVYDEQLREELEEESDPKELFLRLADQGRPGRLRRAPPGLGPGRRPGRLRLARGRPDASRTTPRRRSPRRPGCTSSSTAPNLFVKIPATEPGLPAIEEMIARGKSINVTLIFSLERYAEVAEAYIRGLERLVESGRRPGSRRLGRQLLRLAGRHRGGPPPRGGGRARRASRASSRSPTPSSPTSATRRSSPAGAGTPSPRGVRRRSGASGPRPRPRTPRIATCSTSRT